MIHLEIANRQKLLKISRTRLRRVVKEVLAVEGVTRAEIGIALVDDAQIGPLNEKYVGHAGPTDVITFPYAAATPGPLAGEIVLSTETAQREAQVRGHAADDEVMLYVVHGLLHLLGYDDHAAKDVRAMRRREAFHLWKLGVAMTSEHVAKAK